ncbi:MAG: class I tRNA ligase family protein [Deltaproteobacteria bacterium]|nr:class I tRNA ligase family protein [Deltaproteobacteria bacterium]
MDPKNDKEAWSQESARRWLPVDLYVGGAEHAVLHLLYARFWHKVLFDEGLVPCAEPFAKLVNQGMILGELEHTYETEVDGKKVEHKVAEDDLEKRGDNLVLKRDPSVVVTARSHKMSKSRGNVVNPDAIVERFGVDSMRLYEMFMGPLEATKPWSTSSIQGVRRFLERIWHVAQRPRTDAGADDALARLIHKTVRKVTGDIEALRFNTAISALMVLTNEVANRSPVPTRALETIALLLHPFAPHLAEEVWETLGHPPSIQAVAWPTFDPAMCEDPEIEIPVQVNGKVRGKVKVPADAGEALVLEHARAAVTAHLAGKTVAKEVYVSGKIVTIVVK